MRAWHALATRLGMSLRRVKRETTSREFVRWKVLIEREWDEPTRLEYYLAQIATEIHRSHVKNPKRIKIEDKILDFKRKVKAAPEELDPEERMARSKAHWYAFLGGGPDGE